jgi:hypothetical protein
MKPRISHIGEKYGMLTIVEELEDVTLSNGKVSRVMQCQCDCGVAKPIALYSVLCGNTSSCGCLFIEAITRHGRSGCDTYSSWKAMRQRCDNPNTARYMRYGGRGIGYCDRWDSFGNFFKDMGERPAGMSIDRIDSDLGYSKENCKWSTPKQQMNNMSRNKYITHNGTTKTYVEWSRALGGEDSLIKKRIRAGWANDKAVTTPVIKH